MYRITNHLDSVVVGIGNVNGAWILKCHDQLDCVEGIGGMVSSRVFATASEDVSGSRSGQ